MLAITEPEKFNIPLWVPVITFCALLIIVLYYYFIKRGRKDEKTKPENKSVDSNTNVE